MGGRRLFVALLFIAVTAMLTSVAVAPASAGPVPHDRVVSDDAPKVTPHVLDGEVFAIAEVGDRIILGGTFTRAQNPNGGMEIPRHRLLAFDKNTGEIDPDFDPAPDRTVRSLTPGPDGASVYVGGQFNSIAGQAAFKLARLDVATGQPVQSFDAGLINALVYDTQLVDGTLYVGGHFDSVGGAARSKLAALDPETGAVRPDLDLTFAGVHRGGQTHVLKLEVAPDASRLVAIGNFRTVDGLDRSQVAMVDLGPSAAVADWRTTRYAPDCHPSFQYYVRGLDMSPDGRYFVIATTAAYAGGPPKLCDTVARWEVGASGSSVEPSWVAYSGGDTIYSVEATSTAVYAGGHFRWFNNPFCADCAGPGAVPRSGIAALDPANGVPLAWDPGRTRGRGVFAFLATDDGLYVGSDTDLIAGFQYRARIAYFPLAGGTPVPQPATPELPVQVNRAGSMSSSNGVVTRHYDGTTVGPQEPVPGAGSGWSSATAVFAAGEKVYTARSDGSFRVRGYDGETFGSETAVETYGLTAFGNEARFMTAGFYDRGYIYFTTTGNNALFRRALSSESDIVGAQRDTVIGGISGVDWRFVAGMFVAGPHLYWVSSLTGHLNRVDWSGNRPVPGTNTVVNTSIDWRGGAVFATPETGAPTDPTDPEEPTAAIEASCTDLTCQFDGSGSDAPGGTIESHDWSFGDGESGSGEQTTHTYAEPGTYEVTLEVVTDAGLSDTATTEVVVDAAPDSPVEFVDVAANTAQATAVRRSVPVPASVQAGDTMLLFASTNSGSAGIVDPSGWQRLGDATTNGAHTAVWARTADDLDAGDEVDVVTTAFVKADVVLAVYRGGSVADTAVAAETATTTEHVTPTVDVGSEGGWLVSYWADKSATTTAWTAPTGTAERHQSAGTGAGHVSELLADSDGPVPTGTAGGLTAVADGAQANAAMASVVLTPAG